MIEVVLRKKLLKMEYLSVLEEMIFSVATRGCSEKKSEFSFAGVRNAHEGTEF